VPVALGWLVFGEQPDALAILGGLVIIAAGIGVVREKPVDTHP
jgi:drug/metabolite transporter (DMT)-like permease